MRMKRKCTIFLLIFGLLWGPMVTNSRAGAPVDHRVYGDLLRKYVKDGAVDYQGLKNEEDKLDAYLGMIEETDTEKLAGNEQFAFYVNAYNAWTIKLILGGYPGVKSIKDLGGLFKSPWKKKLVRIDGGVITLDDLEHKILRPRFNDPRVHFAINCASKGCPPLLAEPYHAGTLNKQLEKMSRAFINDTSRNRLEGDKFYVSKIFKWFAEDFNNDIVGFFLKYAKPDLRKDLALKRGTIKVKYLDYDWSLNGK